MLKMLKRALLGRSATNSYPSVIPAPPDGFRGKPEIDFVRCSTCDRCAASCPTSAISLTHGDDRHTLSINYGNCIFCGECETACPDAIHLTKEFQLATTDKTQLVRTGVFTREADGSYRCAESPDGSGQGERTFDEVGFALKESIRKILGRSLHIREVDAGSCNGCEVEITSLNNPVYDIERFGVHFVASPRHADMLLVTGPVTRNMEIALTQTYEATPDPKVVVATGACAIGGGIFGKSYASRGGVDSTVPVDIFIPGCPPRPEALLHGILLAMGRYGKR